MICFAGPALDAEVRKWTWLGINKDTYTRTVSDAAYKWLYDVEHVGFKYHGNSIMAAMGLVALRYVEEDNDAAPAGRGLVRRGAGRRAAASSACPWPPAARPSRHLYQVMVDGRDEVMVKLNAAAHLPRRALPRQHRLPDVRRRRRARARGRARASDRIISLPMHLRLARRTSRGWPRRCARPAGSRGVSGLRHP